MGPHYLALSGSRSPVLDGVKSFYLEECTVQGKEGGVHVEMGRDGDGETGVRESLDE